MRILPKSTLLLGVFLLVVSVTAAQEKKSTKVDTDRLETKAYENLKHISYREKFSNLVYSDDRNPPDISYFQKTEYLRPDRMHVIYEQKFDKRPAFKEEKIQIGMLRYLKRNDEAWKIEKSPVERDTYSRIMSSLQTEEAGAKCGSVDFEFFGVYITKECEFIGVKKFGGQNTRVYRVTKTRTFRRSHPEGRDRINLEVRTLWFDKKGRILKLETVRTTVLERRLWRAVVEYEYDPKDVAPIEAPIK